MGDLAKLLGLVEPPQASKEQTAVFIVETVHLFFFFRFFVLSSCFLLFLLSSFFVLLQFLQSSIFLLLFQSVVKKIC